MPDKAKRQPDTAAKPVSSGALEWETPGHRNAYLAAIIDSSNDAIITKDLQGTITSWNQSAERLFGYTAAEAVGRSILMLIPEHLWTEEAELLDRLRRGERTEHYETIRKRKDGSLLDISLTISPVRDASGKIIGASKIARDITETKRTQEALRKAKEQLARINEELEERVKQRTASLNEALAQMQEFSYTVSHDLRSPVRAIRGYVSVLLETQDEQLNAQSRGYLERIARSGARMEALIHDVLAYSRLARAEIELRPVTLDALVEEIISDSPEMQPPAVEIIVQKPLGRVIGHAASLSQAVSNLLGNSVKFVRPDIPAKLEIWTERRGSNVRLWIKDNGIGIPPEFHARLFGVFERVNEKPEYEGTGIGLAIVRKAIEKMGGTVGLESDGKTGSSFWLELPAV